MVLFLEANLFCRALGSAGCVCSLFDNMGRAADMEREPQGSGTSTVMLLTLTWPSDYTLEKQVSSVWSHPKCGISLTTCGRDLERTAGMVGSSSFLRTAKLGAETTKQCCHELQESGKTLFPASRKQRPSRRLRVVANPAQLYGPLVLALPVGQAPALGRPDVLERAVFEMQCFQGTSQTTSHSPPSLLLAHSELQGAFLS